MEAWWPGFSLSAGWHQIGPGLGLTALALRGVLGGDDDPGSHLSSWEALVGG